jgi:hypothetical protein
MDYDDKSNSALALEERQQGNQKWWTDHTMSYDWKDKIGHEPFSLPWFDQMPGFAMMRGSMRRGSGLLRR